jgi:hypothetical protein
MQVGISPTAFAAVVREIATLAALARNDENGPAEREIATLAALARNDVKCLMSFRAKRHLHRTAFGAVQVEISRTTYDAMQVGVSHSTFATALREIATLAALARNDANGRAEREIATLARNNRTEPSQLIREIFPFRIYRLNQRNLFCP